MIRLMFLGITLFALAGLTIPFIITQADAQPITEIQTCKPGQPGVMCKPTCDCYYSEDCGILSSCGDRSQCTRVAHGTSTKGPNDRYDGTCSFLGIFGVADVELRLLTAEAVNIYIKAYEVAGSSDGGPPDSTLIEQAQTIDLIPVNQIAIQNLANDIVMITVGPAYYDDTWPHIAGFYNPPELFENPMGTVNSMDEGTLATLAHVREGVVAEMKNPSEGLFRQHMQELYETVSDYQTFGRCEYPHPPEHGHDFLFRDGVHCLTSEIEETLNAFNDIVEEGVTAITRLTSDGSVKVIISTSDPVQGEMLPINVQFVDTNNLKYRNYANYNIVVTQNGDTILSDLNVHTPRGSADHLTSALSSNDPVDIKVTLNGFGMPDDESNWYGPTGEPVEFTVVPEFGIFGILVLSSGLGMTLYLIRSKSFINI